MFETIFYNITVIDVIGIKVSACSIARVSAIALFMDVHAMNTGFGACDHNANFNSVTCWPKRSFAGHG